MFERCQCFGTMLTVGSVAGVAASGGGIFAKAKAAGGYHG